MYKSGAFGQSANAFRQRRDGRIGWLGVFRIGFRDRKDGIETLIRHHHHGVGKVQRGIVCGGGNVHTHIAQCQFIVRQPFVLSAENDRDVPIAKNARQMFSKLPWGKHWASAASHAVRRTYRRNGAVQRILQSLCLDSRIQNIVRSACEHPGVVAFTPTWNRINEI
jgi:hypothetical protein